APVFGVGGPRRLLAVGRRGRVHGMDGGPANPHGRRGPSRDLIPLRLPLVPALRARGARHLLVEPGVRGPGSLPSRGHRPLDRRGCPALRDVPELSLAGGGTLTRFLRSPAGQWPWGSAGGFAGVLFRPVARTFLQGRRERTTRRRPAGNAQPRTPVSRGPTPALATR